MNPAKIASAILTSLLFTAAAAAAAFFVGRSSAPKPRFDYKTLNAASILSMDYGIYYASNGIMSPAPLYTNFVVRKDGSHLFFYTASSGDGPEYQMKDVVTAQGIPLQPVCLSCGGKDPYAP